MKVLGRKCKLARHWQGMFHTSGCPRKRSGIAAIKL